MGSGRHDNDSACSDHREAASDDQLQRKFGDRVGWQLQRARQHPVVRHLDGHWCCELHLHELGGQRVPGQNPVPANSGSSGPVQLPTDKNGRATVPDITATLTAPPTPTATEAGCGGSGAAANGKWTVTLSSLQVTGAHFVVTQGNPGPVVFCRDYTPSGPATGTAC